MRKFIPYALIAASALLTACIPSVESFYSEQDLVFDPHLVGKWQKKGEPETWQFEKADGKAYKVIVTEKEGPQGTLSAHLFKIKDDLYLDVIPTECKYAPEQAGIVGASMMPGHLLIAVGQVEPVLKLAFCDYDWLGKLIEKNPSAIAHHAEEKFALLTASTRELQKFVAAHRAEGELFQKAEELVRASGNSPK